MAEPSLSPELAALMPQLAQGPPQAVDQLRPLPDQGDEAAIVLLLWNLQQTGQWPEGIPYVQKGLDLGAVLIVATFISNMMGDDNYRDQALEMLAPAIAGGWAVDPLQWVQTFAQRGDA